MDIYRTSKTAHPNHTYCLGSPHNLTQCIYTKSKLQWGIVYACIITTNTETQERWCHSLIVYTSLNEVIIIMCVCLSNYHTWAQVCRVWPEKGKKKGNSIWSPPQYYGMRHALESHSTTKTAGYIWQLVHMRFTCAICTNHYSTGL